MWKSKFVLQSPRMSRTVGEPWNYHHHNRSSSSMWNQLVCMARASLSLAAFTTASGCAGMADWCWCWSSARIAHRNSNNSDNHNSNNNNIDINARFNYNKLIISALFLVTSWIFFWFSYYFSHPCFLLPFFEIFSHLSFFISQRVTKSLNHLHLFD